MTDKNVHSGRNQGAPLELPLSKTQYVLQRLRQELVGGTILPGSQLRQGDISARYGVSATPVREALRLLEAEGHIDYSPHQGATVNEMPQEDLYALYRFRVVVEKLLTELAVERSDSEALAIIKSKHLALVEAVKAGGNAARLSQLNRDFHVAVMRAGAPYIADRVLKPLWETVIPTSQSQWDGSENVESFLEAHSEIVEAIEEGSIEKAGQLMADHVFLAYKERLSRKLNK